MDGNGQPREWSVKKSTKLYQIKGWGEPYFRINEGGHVEVRPDPTVDRAIDLYELTKQLAERGLDLPLLIRFPNILQDRIRLLNECFESAIREYGYDGEYRGVFPIKVNQQRHLVDEIVESGRPWRFGLEAGSKPELLITLAAMEDEDGFIICNGYKDLAYLETALVAQRFDNTVVVVLERIEELELAFRASEKLGIRPCLGVRAKLSSKGMGRWADSAGDRAKFGLTMSEIVHVVDELEKRDMLDCLKLLHFHLGSQVSSIIPVKNAMREASQIYVELMKMGCKMSFLDVGGGLAVDYDGSKTDFPRLDELRPQGVRIRRGRGHSGGMREGERAAADHRQRERTLDRRLSVGAGLRCAGRRPRRLRRPPGTVRRRPPNPRRVLRDLEGHPTQERPGIVARCAASARRSAEPFQVRLPRDSRAGARRALVLELLREDSPIHAPPQVRARGAQRRRGAHGRDLLLQLLAVPIGARHLGNGPPFPVHADSSLSTRSPRFARGLRT